MTVLATNSLADLGSELVDPKNVELQPFKAALSKERGYVAIPRGELLAFYQQLALTFAAGFSVGFAVGAFFSTRNKDK